MRIGIITGEYPPMEGGVGAFTQELSLALHDLGHQIHILTTSTGAAGGETVETGLMVHRTVPQWGLPGMRQAYGWLQALSPDVVSLQYEPAAYGMKGWITALPRWLQRSRRPPLVITFHDLLPPYLFPKAGAVRQWSDLQMARHAAGCIATNHEDQQALTQVLGSAAPPTRLIPIGSNIATELPPNYDRERTRDRYGFGPQDLVVGFFGFMNRSKGIETLLEAVARLRDAGHPIHLLLIGGRTGTSDAANTQYADEVDEMVRDLHLESRTHRTGFAAQQDVSAALRAIDICALPYRDGANLRRGTLHAALAHGCAIVTTTPNVPVAELQNEAGALFVPPEAPTALAESILRLGSDRDLRQRLSTAATKLAGKFSWPAIAAETAAFFETLQ
ncbi:MAG: glycosyltransferase family 4 protein [Anaerolineae bacterium]|nr:glycosyltransferase family 4 protein [Anaerolineae bacterium]